MGQYSHLLTDLVDFFFEIKVDETLSFNHIDGHGAGFAYCAIVYVYHIEDLGNVCECFILTARIGKVW